MVSIAFFSHFFSLFSVCSLWVFEKKRFALMALVTSLICALLTEVITLKALFIVATYFLANLLFFKMKPNHLSKMVLSIMIFSFSWMLANHMISGFISWQIINSELISVDGEKYSLYLNMDKVIAGLGILIFALVPIRRSIHFRHMVLTMLPSTIWALVIIAATGMLLKVVNFDPKFPDLWVTWIIVSLLVNCVAEEAIFRLFLQGGIQNVLSTYKYAPVIAILISSTAFAAFHAPQSTNYLIAIFIASLFFGYVYHITKRVEASVLLHFITNFIHFFFFTYPLLNQY